MVHVVLGRAASILIFKWSLDFILGLAAVLQGVLAFLEEISGTFDGK